MALGSAAASAQTVDDCKSVPSHTTKPPYTLACSGKSECAATDTLTVTAASGETTPIFAMCIDFGDGWLEWLPAYKLDKPPQPLLSYPLAPLFTSAIRRGADAPNGTPEKVLVALRGAVGAKLAADVLIVDNTKQTFRQPLVFDVAPLWSARQLPLGPIKATCQPCDFNGTVTLEVPALAAWKQSTGADLSKLQLVMNGARMPGLVPRPIEGAGTIAFGLQRFRDKPDSAAAWDGLLKTALASTPGEISVALADDKSELASAPDKVVLAATPFEYRVGLGFATLLALLVAVGFASKRYKLAFLRDDFAIPAGVLAAGESRKLSLGKLQMTAWTISAVVGFVLVGMAFKTWLVLNEINETLVILLGISVATAAGAMAVVPDVVSSAIDRYKVDPTNAAAKTALQVLLRSKGPVADVLQDYGSDSPNLHRVQNLAFTLVLILMFLYAALTTGSFPNFSGNLLALMGVSGGAYVGFKAATR